MDVNATEYKLKCLQEMAKQLIERSVQYSNVAVDALQQAREIEANDALVETLYDCVGEKENGTK